MPGSLYSTPGSLHFILGQHIMLRYKRYPVDVWRFEIYDAYIDENIGYLIHKYGKLPASLIIE